MVLPDAAPSSSLALNGHRVNPLKVHPPAVVTRQSRPGRWWGGTEGKEKEREKTTTGSEKEKCSWTVR